MRRRLVETREKEILEQEADEEEEEICRICHSSGDSKNPLKYPCACSWSIKFVHSKCLLRWMKQRITLKCEVCNHKYSVHRVYAENTPTILPPREFLCGIAMKACHVAPYCVRICFSVLNQLLMLPYIAFWIWRSSVANSLSEAKELLVHSLMFPSTFMIMDWLYVLLIGNIISLLVMWLCSFVEIYAPFLVAPQPGNRNRNADEVREDAEVERQAIAGGLRNCDLVELWLTVFVALLRYFRGLIISVFRLAVHDPVWRTVIYLFTCILFFLISNNVLMSLRLGRMIFRNLFYASSSISTPLIESTLYIENNSLKNASHAITNLSAEVQNDGLLFCAAEVLAETLIANSTRPGEDLSSVGKPLLVYPSSGLYDVITGYMVVVPWMLLVVLHIPIRTVTSKIRGRLRKFLTTMIYPFFLMIHLGALPLVYGCWLDVCTITMLGRYTFLLAMFEGFCVTKICLPYAIELRETVEALLHQWITAVCCTLGLSVFLFSRPEDIGGQENVKVERQQDRLQDRLIAAKDPNRNIFTFNG
ncbi:probable E3 ubiquitin ligase SUD1 [Papaver somniferum]|uniref:probable E3 ubiquitin ligase SUD1 n=1 Tax=Papaver somniferum TaxID=3469 RepID=UPI000E704DF7|nr:probable E3 ubiquitin ligase SUD1 [Papaver somniferum]